MKYLIFNMNYLESLGNIFLQFFLAHPTLHRKNVTKILHF